MESEVLTASITIVSGITIFVIGQIISKFIIEPLNEQAKVIGEIAASLIYYKNTSGGTEPYYIDRIGEIEKNAELSDTAKEIYIGRYRDLINRDWGRTDEAQKYFRHLASQLVSRTSAIPAYSFFSSIPSWKLASEEDISEASRLLIGLSNSREKDNDQIIEVAHRLKIKSVVKRFGV